MSSPGADTSRPSPEFENHDCTSDFPVDPTEMTEE